MNSQDSGISNEHFCGGTPDDYPEPTNHIPLIREMLRWMKEANRRLSYERDKASGFYFGGNPYLNPIFKAAKEALSKSEEV